MGCEAYCFGNLKYIQLLKSDYKRPLNKHYINEGTLKGDVRLDTISIKMVRTLKWGRVHSCGLSDWKTVRGQGMESTKCTY